MRPLLFGAAEGGNGYGQFVQQVGGDQAGLTDAGGDALSGGGVEVDAGGGSNGRGESLGQQGDDYAAEDVAGAASGEAGVGEGGDADGLAGAGGDGVGALEDDGCVPALGPLAGDVFAVGLDFGGGGCR